MSLLLDWRTAEGSGWPLGVSWIEAEQSYNFAIYAKRATSVTVLLYGPDNAVHPVLARDFPYAEHRSGHVWHCRIPLAHAPTARYYAYRIDREDGSGRQDGDRFNASKVLLDPYARAVHFPTRFSRSAASSPGSNAGQAPLGVLPSPRPPFDWGNDALVRHNSDTIIYEMHVKGFTQRANSGVSPGARGTYAGIIERIPYLRELGITAVELMPVCQRDPQEENYWGYMPLHFFSPHAQYAHDDSVDGAIDEFRTMVKALHAAGIEIILDMVYSHTTEADAAGPTYCYRGIDNSTYYLLTSDLQGYRDDAGTGNVLRSGHPTVRNLILASVRFWVTEMHVDGFRFDLASLFTRNADGSINLDDPAVISEISTDPDLAHVRLIAEPWDLATYQLGRSFPGLRWAQWNGRFRDDLRTFVKGDPGQVGTVMRRLYGSDDLFPDTLPDVYHPYQSINFVTCHDGFCLYDLVSYNQKHNEANGHANKDGTDANYSWNCGWEGDAAVPPDVIALRKRQVKTFCTLLLLSNGTPMFCAGDEFMQTQRGNNNPYNQDNEITWLDWDLVQRNADVWRFFQEMIAFRKAHPSLCRSRFWRDEVQWRGRAADPDYSETSRAFAYFLRGASQHDVDLYVMANAGPEAQHFTVVDGQPEHWRCVIETALASPDDIRRINRAPPLTSNQYEVAARSIVVLLSA